MNKVLSFVVLLILATSVAGCSAEQPVDQSLLGSTAPDFTLDDALGGQTSLSDYGGTPVLLFFHMAVG